MRGIMVITLCQCSPLIRSCLVLVHQFITQIITVEFNVKFKELLLRSLIRRFLVIGRLFIPPLPPFKIQKPSNLFWLLVWNIFIWILLEDDEEIDNFLKAHFPLHLLIKIVKLSFIVLFWWHLVWHLFIWMLVEN